MLGRKIEVISRDDAGKPPDAIRLAGELLNDQKVDLLAGAFLSNIGLALSDFALQNKQAVRRRRAADRRAGVGEGQPLHLPPAPLHLHAGGDAGAGRREAAGEALGDRGAELRIRPVRGEVVQAAAGAAAARRASSSPSNGRRWARSTPARPSRRWRRTKPDAIFNVTFGADLTNFVRQGNTRGLFEGRGVVSILTGEPEYLDPLGDETPDGLDRHRLPREPA